MDSSSAILTISSKRDDPFEGDRFRSFFDNAPVGNCITAPDGRLIRVNPALCALLGYSREELETDSFVAITYADDVGASREGARALLAGEIETWTMDKRYVRKDGKLLWTRVTTRLERDARGRPLQFLTHVQDIDDQRRAEEALRESEMRSRRIAQALREAQDRLEHVVISSPAVLYSLRPTPRGFVANWISKNVECLLGYSVDDVLPEDWWPSHLHPEDRDRVVTELEMLFTNDQLAQEYRFRLKGGAYRWLRAELRLLRDAEGTPVEVVGSWADVTARKEAELKVKASEEQYRRLFDSNPHPMYVCDTERLALLAVNEAMVRHYGYSREEFLGMTARDLRP